MRFLRSGWTAALLLWCLVAAAHAATPVTVSNIEAMTNWHDCTTCANGAGTAVYSMTQHQASPSLNGNSTKFSLAGTVGLSDALWYRRSVENSTGVNFSCYPKIVDYSGNWVTIHFQLNGDKVQTPFTVWANKISLKYW